MKDFNSSMFNTSNAVRRQLAKFDLSEKVFAEKILVATAEIVVEFLRKEHNIVKQELKKLQAEIVQGIKPYPRKHGKV